MFTIRTNTPLTPSQIFELNDLADLRDEDYQIVYTYNEKEVEAETEEI